MIKHDFHTVHKPFFANMHVSILCDSDHAITMPVLTCDEPKCVGTKALHPSRNPTRNRTLKSHVPPCEAPLRPFAPPQDPMILNMKPSTKYKSREGNTRRWREVTLTFFF